MAVTRRMVKARQELEDKQRASKRVPCRYFKRGDSYCKHGDGCYYLHKVAKAKLDPEPRECPVCYETPKVFGLLSGCEHVFCLDCISQWSETVEHYLRCPVCRARSYSVVPSNYAPSKKQRAVMVETYQKLSKLLRQGMPCRDFSESLLPEASWMTELYGPAPRCPRGNHCDYRHEIDGQPYVFSEELLMTQLIARQNADDHFDWGSDGDDEDYSDPGADDDYSSYFSESEEGDVRMDGLDQRVEHESAPDD